MGIPSFENIHSRRKTLRFPSEDSFPEVGVQRLDADKKA